MQKAQPPKGNQASQHDTGKYTKITRPKHPQSPRMADELNDDFDNDPANPANRPPRSFATAEEAAAAAAKDANGPPWQKSWADDVAPGQTWTDENIKAYQDSLIAELEKVPPRQWTYEQIAAYQSMNAGRKGDDK